MPITVSVSVPLTLDVGALRYQKTCLNIAAAHFRSSGQGNPLHREIAIGLEGIQGLFDAVQDYLVDEVKLPQEAVFDFSDGDVMPPYELGGEG